MLAARGEYPVPEAAVTLHSVHGARPLEGAVPPDVGGLQGTKHNLIQ